MISAMKKLVLVSAAALLPAPPAAAETPATTTHAGPALWKVADEDTTIYLFGTVHILTPEIEWFDGAIATAFEAADELVTEAGKPDQQTVAALTMPLATLPEGQTVRSLMTDENREQYEARLVELGLASGSARPV